MKSSFQLNIKKGGIELYYGKVMDQYSELKRFKVRIVQHIMDIEFLQANNNYKMKHEFVIEVTLRLYSPT